MRLSRFNAYLSDFPDLGDTLIYNHLSGGMVPITAEGMALLRRIDRDEAVTEAELAEVAELTDPDYGMLVSEPADEERRFAARMNLLRKNTRHLSVVVSTSLACNFGCPYCVQGQVMSGKTMSFETVHNTGRWIVERARKVGVESIDLSFLGGEPLLHPHIIEGVVRQVSRYAREAGVELTFDVVTNGFFLTRAMAERLKALGCRSAKVTLDGDETTHDRTRPQKGGKSSFATIWNNLREAAPVLPIVLNGNFTAETLSGFRPLLQKLRAAGFDRRMIPRISFTPALGALMAPPESTVCRSSRLSESWPEEIGAMAEAIEAAGYQNVGDGTSVGPCGFHNAQHFGIDPEGYVYKCSGFLGLPQFAIGRVTEPEAELGPLYQRALSPVLLAECGDCANRPSCAGACVASAWIAAGGPGDVQCDKPYFQTVAVDAIKRRWRKEQQQIDANQAAA
jgi:uncharacterized protein